MFRLPDLTHVVIVAGDSDYVPLAQRCRRLGRYVVGVGVAGSTAKSLAAACDEFEAYDSLPGVPRRRAGRDEGCRLPRARARLAQQEQRGRGRRPGRAADAPDSADDAPAASSTRTRGGRGEEDPGEGCRCPRVRGDRGRGGRCRAARRSRRIIRRRPRSLGGRGLPHRSSRPGRAAQAHQSSRVLDDGRRDRRGARAPFRSSRSRRRIRRRPRPGCSSAPCDSVTTKTTTRSGCTARRSRRTCAAWIRPSARRRSAIGPSRTS